MALQKSCILIFTRLVFLLNKMLGTKNVSFTYFILMYIFFITTSILEEVIHLLLVPISRVSALRRHNVSERNCEYKEKKINYQQLYAV